MPHSSGGPAEPATSIASNFQSDIGNASSIRYRSPSPNLSLHRDPEAAQPFQSTSQASSEIPATVVERGREQRFNKQDLNTPSLVEDIHDRSSSLSSSSFDENDAEVDNHPQRHTTASKAISTSSKPYTAGEERSVLRKLDQRLTLFLSFLYLLSFLDRSNIGNAKIAGLQRSLDISSSQFDLTLLAFYITYITFEWMILLYRLVPAHIYISCCVFAWGLVACLQSVVTSFKQLLALRALLGITEAAFGPGVPFYMTFFYRREELAYRVGLQISAAPLATSFASSLAWLIMKLNEGGPLESWRALFLFEGFPSLVVAVFAWYFVPDGPGSARWLTKREREVAVARLKREKDEVDDDIQGRDASTPKSSKKMKILTTLDSGTKTTPRINRADLLATLVDPKSYMTALMFLSVNVSFASLPVFLPTIINSMSFSPLTSQILAAPPYLLSFAYVLLIARTSDRIPNSRSIFLAFSAGLSCASYTTIAIVGSLRDHISGSLSIIIRYVAVYGAACGLFASVVLIITWTLNNQRSDTSKGAGMVILNLVGQCGPLIGVKLFPGPDGPFFVKGMAVCAGFMGVVVVLALGLRAYLARLNGRVEKGMDGLGGYQMVRVEARADGGTEQDQEQEQERMLVRDHEDGDGARDEDKADEDHLEPRRRKEFRYML